MHEASSVPFDDRMECTLERLGCIRVFGAGQAIGAAVSGGADSTAMLLALCHVAARRGFAVKAITVNHNMRAEEEAAGDVKSVEELCSLLAGDGYPVSLCVETLLRGDVHKAAAERGRGEEEAARHLRYEAFLKAAKREGLKCIALAHNQNDCLETLVMRFLQGGTLQGISEVRKSGAVTFVRPMLSITREEIEGYLAEEGAEYRTDSTNCDTRYLRNRIRHKVIPVLDDAVPGWRRSVLAGQDKARDDEAALSMMAEAVSWRQDEDMLSLPISVFNEQTRAVRARLVFKAFNLLGVDARVPYMIVASVINGIGGEDETRAVEGKFKKCYAGVELGRGSANDAAIIYAKKMQNAVTDTGFCVIIDGAGEYATPLGTLRATVGGQGAASLVLREGAPLRGLRLPLCVRSRVAADEVVTAEGRHKSVARLVGDWKVKKADRDKIPIVTVMPRGEEEVVCVWGSVLGYEDYLVENVLGSGE